MSCLRGLWGVFDEDPGFAMDTDDLPFTWLTVAGTVPNVLTPSDFIGGVAAGDDDIGAETSSIDPKDTAGPGIATVSRAREGGEMRLTLLRSSYIIPRNAHSIFYMYTLAKRTRTS